MKKIWVKRIVLFVLILLNMYMIYSFSRENGEASSKTSGRVTRTVAEIFVPQFEEKTAEEQEEIVASLHQPIRKTAHIAEFGLLGGLLFFFLRTFSVFSNEMLCFSCSVPGAFLYALTDEWHQKYVGGRASSFTDVCIDTSGALIVCFVLALILYLKRQFCPSFERTDVTVPMQKPMRLALCTDFHGEYPKKAMELLHQFPPDAVLLSGDLTDDVHLQKENDISYAILRELSAVAPTFYALGNHETGCYHHGNPFRKGKKQPLSSEIRKRIADCGVVLLDDEAVEWNGIWIGGVTSGLDGGKNRPNLAFLREFTAKKGYKILLCHHPEYYPNRLKETDINLIVCGHAHGGHWRIGNLGLYAPGQGIFPKYTSGVIDNRCIISRGLGNHTKIPRFHNPTELIFINGINGKEEKND